MFHGSLVSQMPQEFCDRQQQTEGFGYSSRCGASALATARRHVRYHRRSYKIRIGCNVGFLGQGHGPACIGAYRLRCSSIASSSLAFLADPRHRRGRQDKGAGSVARGLPAMSAHRIPACSSASSFDLSGSCVSTTIIVPSESIGHLSSLCRDNLDYGM